MRHTYLLSIFYYKKNRKNPFRFCRAPSKRFNIVFPQKKKVYENFMCVIFGENHKKTDYVCPITVRLHNILTVLLQQTLSKE